MSARNAIHQNSCCCTSPVAPPGSVSTATVSSYGLESTRTIVSTPMYTTLYHGTCCSSPFGLCKYNHTKSFCTDCYHYPPSVCCCLLSAVPVWYLWSKSYTIDFAAEKYRAVRHRRRTRHAHAQKVESVRCSNWSISHFPLDVPTVPVYAMGSFGTADTASEGQNISYLYKPGIGFLLIHR